MSVRLIMCVITGVSKHGFLVKIESQLIAFLLNSVYELCLYLILTITANP